MAGFIISISFHFRAATGESWHLVMKDCFDQALCDPRAGEEATTKCGNTAASIIYFCSFYFLCSFLVSLDYLAVKTFRACAFKSKWAIHIMD